jgi:hypothetical protein
LQPKNYSYDYLNFDWRHHSNLPKNIQIATQYLSVDETKIIFDSFAHNSNISCQKIEANRVSSSGHFDLLNNLSNVAKKVSISFALLEVSNDKKVHQSNEQSVTDELTIWYITYFN